MYSLMVAAGSSVFHLLFKTIERAEQMWSHLTNAKSNDLMTLEDDYGTRILIHPFDIVANLEDMEKTRQAAIERYVGQAKLQHAVTQRLQADPALRMAASGGVPIHTPFPQGNGRLFS